MLSATKRDSMGTRKCQRLRAQGVYPGVVYGMGDKSIAVQIEKSVIDAAFKSSSVKTHPFILDVEGKHINVLVKDILLSPKDHSITHIDFWKVSTRTALSVDLPVSFINEGDSVGVRDGGVVEHLIRDLPVKALPKDMPDSVIIDMKDMNIGDVIHLGDVVLPAGVSLQKPVDADHDPIVVAVSAPRIETEEPTEELEAAAEGESDSDEEAQVDSPQEGEASKDESE